MAIGGNLIAPPQRPPSWERQVSAVKQIVPGVLRVRDRGFRLILTHGNGPQVGAILLQNEAASNVVPPNPLHVCVAQSQAQIGYNLQLVLQEDLRRRGSDGLVIPFITMVVVDENDPAFASPSKPIGPIYQEKRVQELKSAGWAMVKDARGGYRRVVASPRPLEVLGTEFLRKSLEKEDNILIAAGGGGIPVIRTPEGLRGAEAVVDKDLSSGLLASSAMAELLVMVTDVPCAYLRFGKRDQEALKKMTADEARTHLEAGEFPPGSMGPKIKAAIDFLKGGGSRVIITDPHGIELSLEGAAGTTIVP